MDFNETLWKRGSWAKEEIIFFCEDPGPDADPGTVVLLLNSL